MTLDEVVSQLEGDFIKWGTDVAMAKLVSLFPFLAGGIGTAIAGFFVEIIVKELAKQFDYASYYTYKTVRNNIVAGEYEDSLRVTRDAAESGDTDAYEKAKKAQALAFIRVWTLS